MYKYIIQTVMFFVAYSFSYAQQMELKIIERYTNSYKNKDPKGDVYLVLAFSEEFGTYFFDSSQTCKLTIIGGGRKDSVLKKTDFFKNPQTKMLEYYHFISKAGKIENADIFNIYLYSNDSLNFTKVGFGDKDKRKVTSEYKIPSPDASSKEKLRYYKKTGDRQGQLMGQAKVVVIYRRMSCAAKKRKYRKEGINGTKEMTYGF